MNAVIRVSKTTNIIASLNGPFWETTPEPIAAATEKAEK